MSKTLLLLVTLRQLFVGGSRMKLETKSECGDIFPVCKPKFSDFGIYFFGTVGSTV